MAQAEGAADQELMMMEAGQQAGGALPGPRRVAPAHTIPAHLMLPLRVRATCSSSHP